MDLEGIMLSEISQTQKDKYCMISFVCGIYVLKCIIEYTYSIDTKNKLVVARGEEFNVGNELNSFFSLNKLK